RAGTGEICHGSGVRRHARAGERDDTLAAVVGASEAAIPRSARRHDQASRGHHDPAAVLPADCVDTPEPRHDVAPINLDEAHALPAAARRGTPRTTHPSRAPGLPPWVATPAGGMIAPVTSLAADAASPRDRRSSASIALLSLATGSA